MQQDCEPVPVHIQQSNDFFVSGSDEITADLEMIFFSRDKFFRRKSAQMAFRTHDHQRHLKKIFFRDDLRLAG